MHHSFYRTISPNYLIINHTHILSTAPFIFLPIINTLSKPRIYVTFSVKLMNPRYRVKSYDVRFETEDYIFNNETNEIEFTKAPSFCLN